MTERTLRRGLPRAVGGDPWPPAGLVTAVEPEASAGPGPSEGQEGPITTATTAGTAVTTTPSKTTLLRRGLPRVPGGDPWPSAGGDAAAPAVGVPVPASDSVASFEAATASSAIGGVAVSGSRTASESPATAGNGVNVVLRRGLPRIAGGEAWPPQGTTATLGPSVEAAGAPETTPAAAQSQTLPTQTPETQTLSSAAPVPAAPPSKALRERRRAPRERQRWPVAVRVALAAVALGLVAGAVVALVRALLGTEPLKEFLVTYPGEYRLPDGAPIGIPAWVGWQHFFNVFLMVLIIRSGLGVRSEKRPTVFWTSKRTGGTKISLTLWFHQSLDILWLANGALFVVVLFATGQWMRIVPTSWTVFPNALSALLQYLSFNWPTENGWVNYNSLQQLAYFTTVFVAAPLAAATGLRMSGLWPKRAQRLSKAYPVEWARALHFPVMLYFVGFIVVHVFLVLSTGLVHNLNHMYASQDGSSWAGFWIFVGSVVVIAGAWMAARPLLLVPVAKLFGKVSGR
ncbi:hypothetical protein LK10_15885 [Sinomonas humi]|uniref:Cytochrome b561 bacterial/Ni-hydrogenase domain-containing protein n=1 Tax=Sinomonas humi TaxID=1338436 RepID=A0A0B2ADQ2_9MICC|nr:hypothetical protein LK10_15885 [Sinomonas humi]